MDRCCGYKTSPNLVIRIVLTHTRPKNCKDFAFIAHFMKHIPATFNIKPYASRKAILAFLFILCCFVVVVVVLQNCDNNKYI